MANPKPDPDAVHTDAQDVRAGESTGHMRYVLLISVVLAIVILSLIVWGPQLFRH